MKKILNILLALALLVGLGLATAAPVLAATIRYVPSVYPTIQAAINASSDGDTIMVAAGNYGAFVVQNKTNITIIGAEGATVTTANLIDVGLPMDTRAMAGVFGSQNITIKGINFNGAGVNGTNVFGIAYVDSTGRMTGLTVANVNGTELGIGIAIMDSVSTSTVEITGSTISNNDEGIYAGSDSTQEVHFNNIVGNTNFGVWSNGYAIVNATNNWWGHSSGPYHPTANPSGTGNAVSDNVDFEPWMGAALVIVKTETVTNGIIDAKIEADTEVVVTGTATVTVLKFSSNPGGPPPTRWNALGKYIDVYVPDATAVTEIEIRLYYTDAEAAAAGGREESQRLFWWNDSAWVQCSDSGVNTTNIDGYGGYMWAKIRTNTTPPLTYLQGDEWGGYQGPSETPGGGCFIATAAYGTDTAKELDILREFRDTVLLPNSLGAKFVSLYYRTSPPIASFISRHEFLRTMVRVGLIDPIVRILKWTHNSWSASGS